MTIDQQCAKPNGVIGKQTVLDNRRNTTIGQVDCCKNVGLLSRYGCQPPPGVPIVQRIQTLPKKSWKHAFQRIQTRPNKSWKHAFQRLPAYLDRSTHHSVHGLCRVKGVVNSARCKREFMAMGHIQTAREGSFTRAVGPRADCQGMNPSWEWGAATALSSLTGGREPNYVPTSNVICP